MKYKSRIKNENVSDFIKQYTELMYNNVPEALETATADLKNLKGNPESDGAFNQVAMSKLSIEELRSRKFKIQELSIEIEKYCTSHPSEFQGDDRKLALGEFVGEMIFRLDNKAGEISREILSRRRPCVNAIGGHCDYKSRTGNTECSGAGGGVIWGKKL